MKRLSKIQIDHAKSRITAKARGKKAAIEKKLKKGKFLTAERRCLLLKQGKVKLKKGMTRIDSYDDVRHVFDFSPFEQAFDSKEYDKQSAIIDKDVVKLIDELILGDTEQALRLIEKF